MKRQKLRILCAIFGRTRFVRKRYLYSSIRDKEKIILALNGVRTHEPRTVTSWRSSFDTMKKVLFARESNLLPRLPKLALWPLFQLESILKLCAVLWIRSCWRNVGCSNAITKPSNKGCINILRRRKILSKHHQDCFPLFQTIHDFFSILLFPHSSSVWLRAFWTNFWPIGVTIACTSSLLMPVWKFG